MKTAPKGRFSRYPIRRSGKVSTPVRPPASSASVPARREASSGLRRGLLHLPGGRPRRLLLFLLLSRGFRRRLLRGRFLLPLPAGLLLLRRQVLDDRHLGAVPDPETRPDDPGVPALAPGEPAGQRGEQLVGRLLVGQEGEDPAAGMERRGFPEGDQAGPRAAAAPWLSKRWSRSARRERARSSGSAAAPCGARVSFPASCDPFHGA